MMSDFRIIDIEQWERKEQFHFFKDYDNPFFGLTADIEVSKLLEYTRIRGYSFFAAYLYISQLQVNKIKEFRYRIVDGQVLDYTKISAGSTVLKANEVFTFCYFKYMESFKKFEAHVLEQVENCRQPESPLDDQDHNLGQVHYSVIPWVHFRGLSHPRNYGNGDSIPKIVFGKYTSSNGTTTMPISVEAHHSLMDGFHMGQYFEGFQSCANLPENFLEG
ncbi:MAG: chloramphenicol acetyltransferase [FCB group bacterium]|nr:chloramphenicol acetyltransferase [FCB group bacterium]MBL7027848.1 chloramphenicol acetyltransferase [Candidatus Neomarinimicrobiota bacterium]MBL7120929.1 chloramphenicol acetyltransferase [Candidatus Neomarinimicrobiota bacterium]